MGTFSHFFFPTSSNRYKMAKEIYDTCAKTLCPYYKKASKWRGVSGDYKI